MTESVIRIDADGLDQIDSVGIALTEAGDTIPADLRRVVRQAAEQLAAKARLRILEEPAFGPKHTGLRAEISAGVAVEDTPAGSRIITTVPQSNEAVIPRGFDDGPRGWRHPVFGRRTTWVRQRGSFSWFLDTMQDGQNRIESGMSDVLEQAAQRIAAAARA